MSETLLHRATENAATWREYERNEPKGMLRRLATVRAEVWEEVVRALSESSASEPDTGLREAITAEPWSFKEGTLRERLEWCRVQHELGAEWIDNPQTPDWKPPTAAWHRACARWYERMVDDLDAALSRSEPDTGTDERIETALRDARAALPPSHWRWRLDEQDYE